MSNLLYNIKDIRFEINFTTFEQLRDKLSFYSKKNIYKINIPCKKNLRRDFLLHAIQICRNEFPSINLVPHYSIQHQFRRNQKITIIDFISFLKFSDSIQCEEVLLVSGSLRKLSIDSLSALLYLQENTDNLKGISPVGISYNPYLPEGISTEESNRLNSKIFSGCVGSIWLQFGTNLMLLKNRLEFLKSLINNYYLLNPVSKPIRIYGSILIPSRSFLSRFKFRPWKGVYISDDFLNSIEYAHNFIHQLLLIYKEFDIIPIIETDTSTEKTFISTFKFFNYEDNEC